MIRNLFSIFYIGILLFLYSSCKNKEHGTHVIKIDISNMPDTLIYLDELSLAKTSIIDSVRSIDGEAIFSKNLNSDYFYELVIGDRVIPIIPDGDKIIINGSWDDMSSISIHGSSATASIINFEQKISDLNDCIVQETSLKLNNDKITVSPEHKINNKDKLASLEDLKIYIKHYADTVTNLQAAVYAIRNLDPVRDGSYFQQFAQSLSKRFPQNVFADSFRMLISETLKDIKGNMVKIGQQAPTITAWDTNGRLSTINFSNKYTLIDFWASWCPPCRTSNPQMLATYKKWKHPNLQFVSVSLDRQVDKWKTAIIEDKLEWINLVDTLEWEGKTIKNYGFDRIPTNILVDPQGKIIAINLFGIELDEQISQLIKK